MDKALIGLSAIMLALSGAPPASASAPTEVLPGSDSARAAPVQVPVHGKSANDAAWAAIVPFASCTVHAHRSMVENVLTMPPLDKRSQSALKSLADNDCLGAGEVDMPYTLMRGGLYAALYAADYNSAPAVATMTPLDFTADVGGAASLEAQEYLWLHQFADCVVRADTPDSRALVLAGVGNPSENAIFTALASHFNACMVKGQSLTFSKTVLTALIAEVLYRQTKVASVPKSGG